MSNCSHEWRLISEKTYGLEGRKPEHVARWYCTYCRKIETTTDLDTIRPIVHTHTTSVEGTQANQT